MPLGVLAGTVDGVSCPLSDGGTLVSLIGWMVVVVELGLVVAVPVLTLQWQRYRVFCMVEGAWWELSALDAGRLEDVIWRG